MLNSLLKCSLFIYSFTSFVAAVNPQSVAPRVPEQGFGAYPFDLSQVRLTSSRWRENQSRTLAYLKWVDLDRLLYVFRATHKLPTKNVTVNGGWDAPNWRFRGHVQGHFLTAWSQCYAQLGDETCRERALIFVQELSKCQANNVGFNRGYLAGFPESDFDDLEAGNGTTRTGNVPWYVMHKTLAGLLDVWRAMGDESAKKVVLQLAQWADTRTEKLTYENMQGVLNREFGGMGAFMVDLYYQTGDKRWIKVAARFDHEKTFGPLAENEDKLLGLHANTQIPKWIAAVREFKSTGKMRYRDIAANAWNMTISAHTYSIGGNSQDEAFRAPNAISKQLHGAVSEGCNSYNMLKLTRELWSLNADPRTTYFDYYERTLLNHLLGQQNPKDPHGHVTYYTDLKPGARRGHGPGGVIRYTDDYNSFWCCQGTGTETNTKLMDSIYWRDEKESTLFVNLFIPSVLNWSKQNTTITQTTQFPVTDHTTLRVSGGSGEWTMKIRIPSWTSNAQILVNGKSIEGVRTATYTSISKIWNDGDEIQIQLPMRLWMMPTNDRQDMATLFYGPSVLSGNYGDRVLRTPPTLDLSSVRRIGTASLQFTGLADGEQVTLSQFYDAHGHNYNIYWIIEGHLSSDITASVELV